MAEKEGFEPFDKTVINGLVMQFLEKRVKFRVKLTRVYALLTVAKWFDICSENSVFLSARAWL